MKIEKAAIIINLFSRPLTTTSTTINQSHLLKICTILYQQQNSPKLHTNLTKTSIPITHEFFLQVCNHFPLSYKPVHAFFRYTQQSQPPFFQHTPTSLNKMLDIIGKSRNIDLFWEVVHDMARQNLVNDTTFRIALRTLAGAREMNKCLEFFHFMNRYNVVYDLGRLNMVVKCLCKCKLVEEAKFVVLKLSDVIEADGVTYTYLVSGFCEVGDLVEAGKVWNLMVEKGFEPGVDAVEVMMETFFKTNKDDEALKLFQMMRIKRMGELGLSTYRLVISWMCKKGKVAQAYEVFDEMRNREISVDNLTMSSLIYGLVTKSRIREAHQMLEGIKNPDISVYHGLMKGLIKLKKASEATQVFREMVKRGCEPTMHTYVMLLQGHLGRRGRKGHDPLVNFDSIFVGGLVKGGKSLEASKYVERVINRGLEVPRFDYNRFLYYFSNEEGVVMFEETGKKLREVGLIDMADIFVRFGEKMATRDRRRNREAETSNDHCIEQMEIASIQCP